MPFILCFTIPYLFHFVADPLSFIGKGESYSYLPIVALLSFVLVATSSIIIHIYDIVILKVIYKNHHNSIETIGQHIQP